MANQAKTKPRFVGKSNLARRAKGLPKLASCSSYPRLRFTRGDSYPNCSFLDLAETSEEEDLIPYTGEGWGWSAYNLENKEFSREHPYNYN
jgi:hypothetical protein